MPRQVCRQIVCGLRVVFRKSISVSFRNCLRNNFCQRNKLAHENFNKIDDSISAGNIRLLFASSTVKVSSKLKELSPKNENTKL